MDGQPNKTLELEYFGIPNGNVPQLPSWVIDPDSDHAAQDAERDLVAYFTKQFMAEREISYDAARQMLDIDRIRLIAEGARRALRNLNNLGELGERASTSLAYKAYKAQLHAYDPNEPQTFEEFLLERIGTTKSPGEVSQATFMLGLLEAFEKRGERQFVEDLFGDRKGYAKFSKTVPQHRQAMKDVKAAEDALKESNKRWGKMIRSAKTEEERLDLLEKKKEVDQLHQEKIEGLWGNVETKLIAAAKMSRDPNIDVEEIGKIVATVTVEFPEGNFQKPPKLPVDKMSFGDFTAYLIVVKPEGEKTVELAISDFADVVETAPEDALERFIPYMKETIR